MRRGSRFLTAVFVTWVSGIDRLQAGPIHSTVLWSEVILTTSGATLPYVRAVAVADFDGDGFPDVVAAAQYPTNLVVWYRNNGDGTFGSQNIISNSLGGPNAIVATDLDSDGRIDIVCASQDDSKITWFKNVANSAGNLSVIFEEQPAISTTADLVQGIAAADLNGDASPDIVFASYNAYTLGASRTAFFRNLHSTIGQFGLEESVPPSAADASPWALSAADLNGDSVSDLVVATGFGNLSWYRGSRDGSGNPQFTRFAIASGLDGAVSTAIGDLDGDNSPDILVVSSGSGSIRWFRNLMQVPNSNTPFSSAQTITNIANGAYCCVAADINKDGKFDVIGASWLANNVTSSDVTWYENLGNGDFGWSAANPAANVKVISTSARGAITVAAADFNLDGMVDVVSGSQRDGKVAVHFNQGGQTALATTDTAPATLMEGRRSDFLRIAVSNRGIAGDNNAQLSSVSLALETSAGMAMTTAQAKLLIDRIEVYRDTNNSNAFEYGNDTLVGSVTDLTLNGGLLSVPIAPANPADAQVGQGTSCTYFVVAKIGAIASSQVPKTIRITHRSKGSGRTALTDATTGAALTVETAGNTVVSSALVTAQPAHTYTDFSYIYFDGQNSPGAAPLDDFDRDGILNVLEFSFGTDSTKSSSILKLSGSGPGSTIIQRGLPTVVERNAGTGAFNAIFCRRKDPLSGLTYTPQFASDLNGNTAWENSTVAPTLLADDGVIQAVSVPFPLLLSNLKAARFFRLAVTSQ